MAVTKCEEICLAVKKGTRRRGGVVQTRERRGDWGLAGPRGLEGQSGAKVQNTTHWLEVTADPALTNHRKQRAVQIMCS